MADLLAGCIELVASRTAHGFVAEFSDVVFGVGRLFGSLCGSRYVSLPGAGLSERELTSRVQSSGCVRSAGIERSALDVFASLRPGISVRESSSPLHCVGDIFLSWFRSCTDEPFRPVLLAQ